MLLFLSKLGDVWVNVIFDDADEWEEMKRCELYIGLRVKYGRDKDGMPFRFYEKNYNTQ